MAKTFFLIIILVLMAACVSVTIPDKNYCVADSDCVPAKCCHANESVNKIMSPNCQMISCSQECVPGTIDCNQGEIKCLNNECKVRIF